MTPQIDGEHHNTAPLCHDLPYHVEDGVPVLDREMPEDN